MLGESMPHTQHCKRWVLKLMITVLKMRGKMPSMVSMMKIKIKIIMEIVVNIKIVVIIITIMMVIMIIMIMIIMIVTTPYQYLT